MNHDFTAAVKSTTTGAVLEFAGELDADTAPEALEVVQRVKLTHGQQLVVNLAGLTFCDSSGISTLIAARNLAVAAAAGIALVAVPQQLARSLALIGLNGFFPVFPTLEEADEAWAALPED
jgi:anti-sigma B factor antagonist